MNADDIIGRRFGMLVVQSEADPVKDSRGHTVQMFICRCDCGAEKVFRYNNLMSGMTNSCGCSRFAQKPPVDLTGRRFGKLLVLFETEPHYEKSGKKIRRWLVYVTAGMKQMSCNPTSSALMEHGAVGVLVRIGLRKWAGLPRT